MTYLREIPRNDRKLSRRGELLAFFILAFGVWPVVAIGTVAGYGFLVWFYQMIFGPPGPPPTVH